MSKLERLLVFLLFVSVCLYQERRVHTANERAAAAEQWAEAVSNEATEMLERISR